MTDLSEAVELYKDAQVNLKYRHKGRLRFEQLSRMQTSALVKPTLYALCPFDTVDYFFQYFFQYFFWYSATLKYIGNAMLTRNTVKVPC